MKDKFGRTFLVSVAILLALAAFELSTNSANSAGVVNVTASVTATITCSTNIASVSFGTLSAAAIASTTGTTNASTSLSCNTGLGCTLSVNDAGNGSNPGLATTTGNPYIIGSSNGSFAASTTIVAGTESYGIQATSTTEGSGGTITVGRRYSSSTYGNIGGLSLSTVTLASSTAQIANRSVVVSHWAAISATTQAGAYFDTITYSCTGN